MQTEVAPPGEREPLCFPYENQHVMLHYLIFTVKNNIKKNNKQQTLVLVNVLLNTYRYSTFVLNKLRRNRT